MTPIDIVILATVVGSVMTFGTATVLALGWAVRSGQFENFQQGAQSIFGPDEPIGEATDSFPDSRQIGTDSPRERQRNLHEA